MAASLHSIPLPPITQDDDSLTWDQSIADIPAIDPDEEPAPIANRSSLTFHAIAHGKSVVGTLPSLGDNVIKWQTNFDHDVVALASNNDGTVTASATKSHVSLIKGCDGTILASRQIASDKSHASSPGVVFVSRPRQLDVHDALVVFRPTNDKSDIILISNIDGSALNSSQLNEVKEAAGEMKIGVLTLPVGSVCSISGVFVNEETIRFFVAGGSTVGVYDYNISEMKSEVVVEDLLGLMPGSWKCIDSVELGIDEKTATGAFPTVAARNEAGKEYICWFNVLDLSLSATHLCQSAITSLKSVKSCNPEQCVAAVYTTTNQSNRIHVVQSLIAGNGKLPNDSESMLLFTIEADTNVRSVELASPPTNEEQHSYAFRYMKKFIDDNENTCAEFVAGGQAQAGMVHYLLVNNYFDEAYACINELDALPANDMVSSPIHISLVALWQFRHVLSKGNIASKENIIESKECLRRLVSSAISGGDKGVSGLVSAAKFLMSWPKNQMLRDADKRTITVQEVCMALSAMTTAVTNAVEVLGGSKVMKLQEIKQKLDGRQTALRGLREISDIDRLQITLDDPYLAIGSLTDLMNCLVSQGAFKSVERLMKSQWGKQIPSNVTASSVLHIPVNIDPRSFLPWLCDLILPTLSIGDPLLETIRAWSCGAADKYDEENDLSGLDNAIMLLKSVSKATARLTVAMHTSFARQMPVNADGNEVDSPETPKHGGSFFTSFDSKASSSRSFYNRPSVLNIGMISGMKTKGSKVFSAKRVEHHTAASPDANLFARTSVPIDEDLEYDCVEDKLNEALRLKEARSLGMDRECLMLKNYSNVGEQYIVKELVKVALNLVIASAHETYKKTVDKIRQFATYIKANFDEAVHSYAIELCDSSRDNIPDILHQAETLCHWCSSPQVRCLIVLKMLRKALVSIQRPPDLSDLASNALCWVTDGSVKSELEEALRLLTVDSLVRKYCGNGAQECFRVTEPMHCRRLVQYIADQHFDTDDVLEDLFVLCDAFNASISKVDTCVSCIQRVMFARIEGNDTGRTDHISAIMDELYLKDRDLAERVGDIMIEFCTEIIEDCRHMILQGYTQEKQRAILASSTAHSILSVMNKKATKGSKRDSQRITDTLRDFHRISMLQNGDVFLSLAELRNPASCVSVLVKLLDPCVELLQQKSFEDRSLVGKLKPIIASAKHWCAILAESPSEVENLWSRSVGTLASTIAKTDRNHASLLLLQVSGVLQERGDCSSFHSVISVALTLFGRASEEATKIADSMTFMSKDEENLSAALRAMRSLAQASMLLREHIILFSPPSMLSSSISLVNLSEFVCDVSCRSDLGIGEKLERYVDLLRAGSRKHRQTKNSAKMPVDKGMLPNSPVFHPSWYIGDGLLLRPVDTLLLCMATCDNVLDFESNESAEHGLITNSSMNASDIIHVLESRGAHYTSLRLVSFSDATALSRNKACPFSDRKASLSAALAQRSLGGMESGLTSGAIDHLLSVSFLIGNLPKETAFNIYQSALPSSIGQRDFARVLTLASIGVYCGVGRFSSGQPLLWNKQNKLMEQCNGFVVHSKMWSMLSRFQVSFDPAIFTQSKDSSASALQGYCEELIWSAARELDAKSTLKLSTIFAKYYSVNKNVSASTLIKFLLSVPDDGTNDTRLDLELVEEAIRNVCLPTLPVVNQSKVLRQCVVSMEESADSGSDYDRFFMILTLYNECLAKLSPFMTSDSRKNAHMQESERIQRRLNALILLSSTFDDKYPPEKKPNYTKLFEPLPNDPSQPSSSKRQKHSFLDDVDKDSFDPMSPLRDILVDDISNAMTASLSPLCSLLGLPTGYIHARSLVVKFLKMERIGESLPPPESSLYLVVKKLSTAGDRADLSWWCSSKYDSGSSEQLKCLELAHMNATLASEQLEIKGGHVDADEEMNAIERVKRIDSARAMLSDHIIVHDVITRHPSTSDMVQTVYKSIVKSVQSKVMSDDYMPERLVKELLLEGSMAAAQASLDIENPFATTHFRSLAMLVHESCRMLSDRYSHINIGRTSRAISRRWLIHGDEVGSAGSSINAREVTDEDVAASKDTHSDLNVISEDSEVTSEFVMDIAKMNISSGDSAWSRQNSSGVNGSGTKSSAEPSVFGFSQRELSELNVSRTALRISFLMCFAQDYHQNGSDETSDDDRDENASSNITTNKKDMKARARSQHSIRKSQCFEGDLALAHAKELLGIVFAQQGTVASAFMFDDSHDGSFTVLDEEKVNKNKALSFAMRHRALRVASILCPYEVLLRVMLEEGYADDLGDDHVAKIAFGSFVAMEIEAAASVQPGLSLPHSNLVELSAMNFPSYARSIWRSQGGISSKLGGRLHLLLLELSVNHHETADWDMFVLMFNELSKNELPRSLLLACEIALQSNAIERAALMNRNDVIARITEAAKEVFESMSVLLHSSTNLGRLDASSCFITIDRFLRIIYCLSADDAIHFVEKFDAFASQCKDQGRLDLWKALQSAIINVASHLSDLGSFSKLSAIIKSTCCDQDITSRNSQVIRPTSSACAESIQSYEKSFD